MQIAFEKGRFSVVHGGKRFFFLPPEALLFGSGKSITPDSFDFEQKKDVVNASSEKDGLVFTLGFTADGEFLKIALSIENKGDDLPLSRVYLLKGLCSESFELYDMIYVSCEGMIGVEGIRAFDRDRESSTLAALTDKYGNGAFLMGFTDNREESHFIETFSKDMSFSARAMRDGVVLKKGATLEIKPLFVAFGQSLNKLLCSFGDMLARDSEAKFADCYTTGWCDWYYFYGQANEEDILKTAKEIKESQIAKCVKLIQIDDGWTGSIEQTKYAPCWGDWEAGSRFGKDLKAFTDKIHALGFKAGIWLAPFLVARESRVYAAHPDWVIGLPDNDKRHDLILDLSNPEVLEFVKKTFKRVFDEWRFDYIKIDFIGQALEEGVRHSREKTRAAYYHEGDYMAGDSQCAYSRNLMCNQK